MKITKKAITASKVVSTDEMLAAFEAKLDEMKVNSSKKVTCSDDTSFREVSIDADDYDECYIDEASAFGPEIGAIYSLGEIKEYLNENSEDEPILDEYASFDDWFEDTYKNYLSRC